MMQLSQLIAYIKGVRRVRIMSYTLFLVFLLQWLLDVLSSCKFTCIYIYSYERMVVHNDTIHIDASAISLITIYIYSHSNTGAEIPCLGLGTWQSKPNEVYQAVLTALKAG